MSDAQEVPQPPPASASAGAMCAVHAATPADEVCARCGSYMCADCSSQHTAAECLACRERAGATGFPFDRDNWSLFSILDYAWQIFRHYWVRLVLLTSATLFAVLVATFASGWLWQSLRNTKTPLAFFAVVFSTMTQVAIRETGLLCVAAWLLRAIAAQSLAAADLLLALLRLPQALILAVVFALPLVLVNSASVVLQARPEFIFGYDPAWYLLSTAAALAVSVPVNVGLMFVTLTLVDDASLNAVQALRRSWAMTEGQRLALFADLLIIALIAGSGSILCGVGLVISVPYAALAFACVYNALRMKESPR